MVYITGDTHKRFDRIEEFCYKYNTTIDDIMIILGDSCINYFNSCLDIKTKDLISKIPITLFCIQGNHEQRAELISSYKPYPIWENEALIEEEYPNIIFGLDGRVYRIPTKFGIKDTLVIGGAYTVDSWFRRLIKSDLHPWWPTEQPTDEIKGLVEHTLENRGQSVDILLTHTCPYRYLPYEWFLSGLDQTSVDRSTEIWLDKICENLKYYERWYCGHFHGDKKIDKLTFMFTNIEEL